ncbi:MAG: segregation/condensation protein A [Bacillota bacterium]|nr:segregation/condensation protein A [Bacillota bacterium]
MGYVVQLEVFTGPMDLLLHLVQKEQVSIYDIPIARITEEYLRYLETLHELDLDVISDFLVIAATLIQIKASLLVPQPPETGSAAPAAEEEGPDLRAQLVQRLLVYKKYRQAAEKLRTCLEARNARYTRWPGHRQLPPAPGEREEALPELPVDVWGLRDLVRQLLAQSQKPEPVHAVAPEKTSLRRRIREVLRSLKAKRELLFSELLPHPGPPRLEIVITFLAVLELLRAGLVAAYQATPLAQLRLAYLPRTAAKRGSGS